VEKVFGEETVRILDHFKGKQLKGKRYHPLFTFMPVDKPAHYVVQGDFVTTEDGTGLVHIAPAFGADDMQMALEEDLPILMTVAEDGTFINEVRPWSGESSSRMQILSSHKIWRRGSAVQVLAHIPTPIHSAGAAQLPLLYYARPTWYIRTSQHKQRLVELNERINWYPGHIKHGRLATGWRTMSTGRWAASAIGAHRCRCGSAKAATIRMYRFGRTAVQNGGARSGGAGPAPPAC
jgi:isoleucyl-tRNA synthetase